MWGVTALGALACMHAARSIPASKIDLQFMLLCLALVVLGSRVAIRVPRINTNITVDDTFVFMGLLLYGAEAATLLGALSGLSACLRISKRPRTVLFAGASLACSIFVTSHVLTYIFGPLRNLLMQPLPSAVSAVSVMALVQYFTHTGVVATANALKDRQSIWHMWHQNFLWISVTYFIGAAAASIIVKSIGSVGFIAFLIIIPIIAIVYFSYDRYLRDVKSSAKQAELAERARAEAGRGTPSRARRGEHVTHGGHGSR